MRYSIVTRFAVLSLMLLVSCVRYFEAFEPVVDGGAEDGPGRTEDAGLGSFGTPQRIAALSHPAEDDDPTLTADLLEIYFDSERSGGGDIWVSKRLRRTDPWDAPVAVTELNTESRETNPEISADGLTIHFSSIRPEGQGNQDIYLSTRPDRSSAWSTPTPVAELNSTARDLGAAASDSGKQLVFSSTRSGGLGDEDLYLALRSNDRSPWNTPVALREINTPARDASPMLASGDRYLFFESERAAADRSEIYVATRTTAGGAFGRPVSLAELNSPGDDGDPWVSADLKTIVFVSDRDGNEDIYLAER